jgi:hypothetical protein
VQVDVTPGVASAVSGVPITFNGTIKNANPYPIVDGSVYVKILRQRGNGEKDANGPDVVDQFYAADNLTIPANGEIPISINWNIPSYAVSGEYKIATFFGMLSDRSLIWMWMMFVTLPRCTLPVCDSRRMPSRRAQQVLRGRR